jgi:hypothetical protein
MALAVVAALAAQLAPVALLELRAHLVKMVILAAHHLNIILVQ